MMSNFAMCDSCKPTMVIQNLDLLRQIEHSDKTLKFVFYVWKYKEILQQ